MAELAFAKFAVAAAIGGAAGFLIFVVGLAYLEAK